MLDFEIPQNLTLIRYNHVHALRSIVATLCRDENSLLGLNALFALLGIIQQKRSLSVN